jgi:hypothetical protein
MTYFGKRVEISADVWDKGAMIKAVYGLLIVAVMQWSCGASTNCKDPINAQSAACVVEGAVVDCTGVSSLASAVTAVEPTVEKLLLSAVQIDGSIAWASIESQIVGLALQYGTCVIAEIWNYYIHGTPIPGTGSGSGSGSVAPLLAKVKIVPADFTAEFERLRAKIAPGRTFKTSKGVL